MIHKKMSDGTNTILFRVVRRHALNCTKFPEYFLVGSPRTYAQRSLRSERPGLCTLHQPTPQPRLNIGKGRGVEEAGHVRLLGEAVLFPQTAMALAHRTRKRNPRSVTATAEVRHCLFRIPCAVDSQPNLYPLLWRQVAASVRQQASGSKRPAGCRQAT